MVFSSQLSNDRSDDVRQFEEGVRDVASLTLARITCCTFFMLRSSWRLQGGFRQWRWPDPWFLWQGKCCCEHVPLRSRPIRNARRCSGLAWQTAFWTAARYSLMFVATPQPARQLKPKPCWLDFHAKCLSLMRHLLEGRINCPSSEGISQAGHQGGLQDERSALIKKTFAVFDRLPKGRFVLTQVFVLLVCVGIGPGS